MQMLPFISQAHPTERLVYQPPSVTAAFISTTPFMQLVVEIKVSMEANVQDSF